MEFIDKESLYGNDYNACELCEFTRELELLKCLVDVAEQAVERKTVKNAWSFEGICHLFAKTIVNYSKAAYDNIQLGHFHSFNMICRAILENCVFLDIIISNEELELWKYYLVYSYRANIYKTDRTPKQKYLDILKDMYQYYDIDDDFYIKQEGHPNAYIRERYGWTYKINHNKQFTFENICTLIDCRAEYRGFQMMSVYSHGTSFYTKIHSPVFVDEMMTMFVNLYIELCRMVMLYCIDTVDESFDEITDEMESIFRHFIEYEETYLD